MASRSAGRARAVRLPRDRHAAASGRSGFRWPRPSRPRWKSGRATATADVTSQSYPPAQVQAGQRVFSAQCGFCHGRDAMGGDSGPDLTRSTLVAEDVRGDKIGAVVRNGRVEKGMPA